MIKLDLERDASGYRILQVKDLCGKNCVVCGGFAKMWLSPSPVSDLTGVFGLREERYKNAQRHEKSTNGQKGIGFP